MALDLRQVLLNVPQEVRERYDFSTAVYDAPVYQISGIICLDHGPFRQYTGQLRKPNGAHCPGCGDVIRRAKSRLTLLEFVQRASDVHAGFYRYEKVRLLNTATKVVVTCPTHGDFEVTPNNHLKSRGCPACGHAKKGHRKDAIASARATADAKMKVFGERFETEARAIHGDAYDYSETIYAGRRSKLTIQCPLHGPFTQTAGHHLTRSQGCPACSHHQSRGESEIVQFISAFMKPVVRDRNLIAPKELDIYVPEAKLAIEYCGEYWHGSRAAKYEAVSRVRHLEKQDACEALGIRLLTVWESEWLNHSVPIKRLIRNAIGRSRGSVMARKCDVRRVAPSPAKRFFDRYHIQGGGGAGEHYGLYYGKHLVACMRFTKGSNDRGPDAERQWTLSRYATSISVPGGGSRLFKAFTEEFEPELVKSFSDNRWFDGAMYERLGFKLKATLGPDYKVYHQRLGLLPKTSWRREKIADRIRDLKSSETYDADGDPRSERKMTYLLGGIRLYDCGKKKWVWTPS